MKSIVVTLLLACSFSAMAKTKVMRFEDSGKSPYYIEVREKMQLGSHLLSFRLCNKKYQPCNEIPLGDYDWHSEQQMTTKLLGKKISLATLSVGARLGSDSAQASQKALSQKIDILKIAFFGNDQQIKDMKVLDFARELDAALKD